MSNTAFFDLNIKKPRIIIAINSIPSNDTDVYSFIKTYKELLTTNDSSTKCAICYDLSKVRLQKNTKFELFIKLLNECELLTEQHVCVVGIIVKDDLSAIALKVMMLCSANSKKVPYTIGTNPSTVKQFMNSKLI
jgi:hypothetical protein